MPAKKILVFIDWFEPGYRAGGPIRSIVNLCSHLSDHEFFVITSNTDHASSTPYTLETNVWIQHSNNTKVKYLGAEDSTSQALAEALNDIAPSSVYINSLFSPRFAIEPLRWLKKNASNQHVVVAPRGMLKRGALSVKPLKKRAFIVISKMLGWFSNVHWHATNDAERAEIESTYGSQAQVKVAPNLCATSNVLPPPAKSKGAIKLLTIARVSPEKGILEGIQFLKSIASRIQVQLSIYGPLQNPKYLALCRQAAEELPSGDIQFHGEIAPADMLELWRGHHFLYSTTLGENYGHSIVESFLHGRPVIISDRTPWQELEKENVGYSVPLEEEVFAKALLSCGEMDHDNYTALCHNASKKGHSVSNDIVAVDANKQLFIP